MRFEVVQQAVGARYSLVSCGDWRALLAMHEIAPSFLARLHTHARPCRRRDDGYDQTCIRFTMHTGVSVDDVGDSRVVRPDEMTFARCEDGARFVVSDVEEVPMKQSCTSDYDRTVLNLPSPSKGLRGRHRSAQPLMRRLVLQL